MRKINTLMIAGSLALTTVFVYLMVALWFVVSPDTGFGFFQTIMHGVGVTTQGTFDISEVVFADFILGLAACTLLAFVVGLVFPTIYNRSARRRSRRQAHPSATLSRPVQL